MFKFFSSLVARISVRPRWLFVMAVAAITVGILCISTAAGCRGCDANTGGCTPAAAKNALVDCVHQDEAKIQALLVELGDAAVNSVVAHGDVDWVQLGVMAAREGVAIGGCAFAQFVHGVHTPSASSSSSSRSSPAAAAAAAAAFAPIDPQGLFELERFRSSHGNVRWLTAKGIL